jgi:hypothetical protein
VFPAASDIRDGAGHVLVTSYALLRPDGQWSLLVVNKYQENAYNVAISFEDREKGTSASFAGPVSLVTFGKDQYQWHPGTGGEGSLGMADPDGPALKSTVNASAGTKFQLPAASVTVIRGASKTGASAK